MDKIETHGFNVVFLGGKQAGIIGLLTTIAIGCQIKAVVTVSSIVRELAGQFNLPIYHSVKQDELIKILPQVDLMVSVHSREIIPMSLLNTTKLGGINIHPCLKVYKGKNPIQRFLEGEERQASVGVHWMTDNVDMGKTIYEIFIDIDRQKVNGVIEVYNILYPYYSIALIKTLSLLRGGGRI
jgi:methionyl-tRNA formyltransferase